MIPPITREVKIATQREIEIRLRSLVQARPIGARRQSIHRPMDSTQPTTMIIQVAGIQKTRRFTFLAPLFRALGDSYIDTLIYLRSPPRRYSSLHNSVSVYSLSAVRMLSLTG
jgi:hypothetical protein